MDELDRRLIQVVPSERQLRLQRMEFYAFVHFTINTFTDREWATAQRILPFLHPAGWMRSNGRIPSVRRA